MAFAPCGAEAADDDPVQLIGKHLLAHEPCAALKLLDSLPPEAAAQRLVTFLRGYALYELGEYRNAMKVFRDSEMPGDPDDIIQLRLKLRAFCGLEIGDDRSALVDLRDYANRHFKYDQDINRIIVDVILKKSLTRAHGFALLRSRLAQESSQPWIWLWRGIAEYQRGNDARAEADLTEFIAQQPSSERGLYWRSKIRCALGRDHEAVADYVQLLRLNAAHGGRFDEKAARKAIENPGDISFGKHQVELAMRDRPKLGCEFDSSNPLHVWAALGFQKKIDGWPILWDPEFIYDDTGAYNSYSSKKRAWTIHVSAKHIASSNTDELRNADELWSSLMFELENVTNRGTEGALIKQAIRGDIDEKEYVGELIRYEWLASPRSRAFYTSIYFPWAENSKIPTDYGEWYSEGMTFADRLHDLEDYKHSPWEFYGKQYRKLRGTTGDGP